MENPIVELYAGDLWTCQMIHSLLTDSGIESFLRNDLPAAYAYVPQTEQTVRVMIREVDFDAAARIVTQFQTNRMNNSTENLYENN